MLGGVAFILAFDAEMVGCHVHLFVGLGPVFME